MRRHGDRGPLVIVVHGGPGAPGSAAPLAQLLARDFRVLEPWQRRSRRGHPLTVARHVEDLHALAATGRDRGARPAFVGHSWGAMLALAAAAAHPGDARALVLVGCGTFDAASRAVYRARVEQRLTPDLRRRIDEARRGIVDPDTRLGVIGRVMRVVHAHDLAHGGPLEHPCDALGHEETWTDYLRLESAGVYPAAFASVTAPVLMLHGREDPHPGALIHEVLRPHLPRLEYAELEHCGHEPWAERRARDVFLQRLRAWLRYER